MTRHVQKPNLQCPEYSSNQQLVDTAKPQRIPGVTPLKLDVSPPGVTDMNRPMLMKNVSNKVHEPGPGIAAVVTPKSRIKDQNQHTGEPLVNGGRVKAANLQQVDDLTAMRMLLQEIKGSDTVLKASVGVDKCGQTIKRSRSEPMQLPPIDESQRPPGQHRLAMPVHTQARTNQNGVKYSSGDASCASRRHNTQQRSAGRSEAVHTLPSFSRVKDNKNSYIDSSFMRGVERHSRVNMNMNAPMSKPARVTRNSWKASKSQPNSQQMDHTNSSNTQCTAAHPLTTDKSNEVQLRLRDMDLVVFPIRKKKGPHQHCHYEPFQNHLEQMRQLGGGAESAPKHTNALDLLTEHKQRNTNHGGESTNLKLHHRPNTSGTKPKSTTNLKRATHSSVKQNCNSATTPKINPIISENSDSSDAEINDSSLEKDKNIEKDSVYKKAIEYIATNNLLPPDKCRRIQDWVNSVDLTLEYSPVSTPRTLSSKSNCSDENETSPEPGLGVD